MQPFDKSGSNVGTASQVSSHNSEKEEKEESVCWQAAITVFKLQTSLSTCPFWDGGSDSDEPACGEVNGRQFLEDTLCEIAFS